MKRYQKIILGIVLTSLIAAAGGYYWLTNGWKKYISEEELVNYSKEIKDNPPLPEEFRELYYKLHPEEKEATLTSELAKAVWSVITDKRHRVKGNCSCDDVIHHDWNFTSSLEKLREARNNPFKYVQLGFGLEKFLTNEECLNYSLRIQFSHDFIRSYNGYAFEGKNFDELNREEIIDFFIAQKAPTLFSPRINPERYLARKKVIEEIIGASE